VRRNSNKLPLWESFQENPGSEDARGAYSVVNPAPQTTNGAAARTTLFWQPHNQNAQ
jgi:hypothetical protein